MLWCRRKYTDDALARCSPFCFVPRVIESSAIRRPHRITKTTHRKHLSLSICNRSLQHGSCRGRKTCGKRRKATLLAESCTRGIGWITSIPGASRYFLEGSAVYSNEAKMRTCNVPEEELIHWRRQSRGGHLSCQRYEREIGKYMGTVGNRHRGSGRRNPRLRGYSHVAVAGLTATLLTRSVEPGAGSSIDHGICHVLYQQIR